ncbi:FxsA family protein [Ornithinibacillus scapharcae]|uniref:FxsA family protein n=1 Tax=Ornithinibacillus scapharcae TaxID=1147159 RepID=UPI000225C10B|nr:FxsA family protein [Ornithinibacillus scapharcae]
MRGLFIAFLILSAAEIGVIVWAGGIIGPWWVALLILFTGFLGVAIAKKEGVETWQRAQRLLQSGQVPTQEILDGISILIGGILLFSPGFITDITGFFLVLPFTRKFLRYFILIGIKKLIDHNKIIYRRW